MDIQLLHSPLTAPRYSGTVDWYSSPAGAHQHLAPHCSSPLLFTASPTTFSMPETRRDRFSLNIRAHLQASLLTTAFLDVPRGPGTRPRTCTRSFSLVVVVVVVVVVVLLIIVIVVIVLLPERSIVCAGTGGEVGMWCGLGTAWPRNASSYADSQTNYSKCTGDA